MSDFRVDFSSNLQSLLAMCRVVESTRGLSTEIDLDLLHIAKSVLPVLIAVSSMIDTLDLPHVVGSEVLRFKDVIDNFVMTAAAPGSLPVSSNDC